MLGTQELLVTPLLDLHQCALLRYPFLIWKFVVAIGDMNGVPTLANSLVGQVLGY